MAKQTTPRKRGRKSNIERSLIRAAALAREFGEMERESCKSASASPTPKSA